jgi:hypothetical protein
VGSQNGATKLSSNRRGVMSSHLSFFREMTLPSVLLWLVLSGLNFALASLEHSLPLSSSNKSS